MIQRTIASDIKKDLSGTTKIIILYGPRQVGKTTIIKDMIASFPDVLHVNADQMVYNEIFSSRDLQRMQQFIGSKKLLFIDEAQNIKDIGINLKILHDEIPELKIVVTGSSPFDLANKIREPLTGRTKTYQLYPLSAQEIINHSSVFDYQGQLEQLMRFGSYPEVLSIKDHEAKKDHLIELSASYLYKDILQLSGIRYADKIRKLLQLLALQIGNMVSVNELCNSLGLNHETVSNYIDLLEKGFIIFRLGGYSNNPRKEISKMSKIYFYDLGVRNSLINNFNPLELRQDSGEMWENYLISERMKRNMYAREYKHSYFWRTYTNVEIDYVEDANGELNGYEIKWNRKSKVPSTWKTSYPDAKFTALHKDDYLSFIT